MLGEVPSFLRGKRKGWCPTGIRVCFEAECYNAFPHTVGLIIHDSCGLTSSSMPSGLTHVPRDHHVHITRWKSVCSRQRRTSDNRVVWTPTSASRITNTRQACLFDNTPARITRGKRINSIHPAGIESRKNVYAGSMPKKSQVGKNARIVHAA